ncbi:MAG TPA: serine hydrolase domain-containing protein, partial [Phytomonospora sp.]
MKARKAMALAAAVLALAACKPEAVPAGPGTAEAGPVETWAASLVPWGLRGAVAVVEDGTTTVSAGFGALTPGGTGTIGTGTRMAIGSLTKSITALAVWRLADQGRVGIDGTLGELLPGVPADKAPITVEQLMAHTSGVADTHGPDDEPIDRAEALRRIFAEPLLFAPGEDESYSNSGYTLLAAIIEEASGRSYEDYLAEQVFARAGMTGSGFHADPVPAGATEAAGSGADGPSGTPSGLPSLSWTLRGAGGVVSTVDDLIALDRALFTGSLLSPRT